jgi:hypothetical protein
MSATQSATPSICTSSRDSLGWWGNGDAIAVRRRVPTAGQKLPSAGWFLLDGTS